MHEKFNKYEKSNLNSLCDNITAQLFGQMLRSCELSTLNMN